MIPPASAAGRLLERIENGVIAVLVLAMVLLAGAQILLRNLFGTGIDWGDPLLRAMVLWAAMLGALAAARDDKHIGLDLITHFVHGRMKRVFRFIALVFAALVSAAMAWYGASLVMLDYTSATIAFARVPSWCIEMILPIGFGLLALRLLTHAFLPPRSIAPALAPELP